MLKNKTLYFYEINDVLITIYFHMIIEARESVQLWGK